ncbi:MAG: hypothetical protein WCW66_04400 [Patescibacteria group bacterium]
MKFFFLFLLAFLLINMVLFRIFSIFDFVLWRALTMFGELVLYIIIDRVVLFLHFRALWKKLTPLRVLYNSDLESREEVMAILESCTFRYLTAMAWRIECLTEDQRIFSEKTKYFPDSCAGQAMVTNDLVAHALKDFWRVHWLARSLGVDVYNSWKYYVMPDDVE